LAVSCSPRSRACSQADLSGFYLAIFLVVWSLILRAIAIELRSHLNDRVWRSFWDSTLVFASALLPLLFGVALGNVIRGVPLTQDGWFQLTLFTTFRPRPPVGILDVYTVLVGLFALVAVSAHGAAFLAWQTSGAVSERSRRVAFRVAAHSRLVADRYVVDARGESRSALGAAGTPAGVARSGVWARRTRARARQRSAAGTSQLPRHVGIPPWDAHGDRRLPLPRAPAFDCGFPFTHRVQREQRRVRATVRLGLVETRIPFVLAQFVWLFWLHRRQPARDVHAARVPPSESY
jgi:hypothetical protein